MRAWLVKLHRWFGLGAAAFLFVAGSTGAVIAWDHEIDAWLNPALYEARTEGKPLPATDIARRVEAADPRVQLRYLDLVPEPGKTFAVYVTPRTDPATDLPFEVDYDQVFVDPASGDIQGRRAWGKVSLARENLVPFLYQLHYTLHMPQVGGVDSGTFLMGIIACAWVLDSLVALWISFPRLSTWRRSLAFRWGAGGHRLTFDLHRSGGVWLFALVLMVAVTSVAMNLEDEVMRPVVSRFSTLAPLASERPAPLPVATDADRIPLGQALDAAAAEGRRRGWAQAAGGVAWSPALGFYSVGFFAPGASHGDGGLGPAWLQIDARTGALVGEQVPGTGSAGDLFMQAMLPLHSGRLLGTPGRALLSLLGVAIAAFSVTGVLIWARKRRAQAVTRQRAPRRLHPSIVP